MRGRSADWPRRGDAIRSIGLTSNWHPIVGTSGGRVHGLGLRWSMADLSQGQDPKWSTVLLYSGRYAVEALDQHGNAHSPDTQK
jgi:hypothetical protein